MKTIILLLTVLILTSLAIFNNKGELFKQFNNILRWIMIVEITDLKTTAISIHETPKFVLEGNVLHLEIEGILRTILVPENALITIKENGIIINRFGFT